MSADSDFEQLLRQLARGTPVEPTAPGERLADRYRVDELVGAGGMGRVFRAWDERDGRVVAVKLVAAEHRRRFLREAEVLAQLDHPHVVRYLDHGETEAGTPLLVMEWLDGEDLASRLSGGALEPEQALRVVRGAAAGLGAAHRAGVVHRDVKPGNLFLVGAEPSRTRVLDFGIAQAPLLDRTVTATGAVMGTVGYMAPEQARGAADVDSRSDVFSLGCVLYECLFGEPAFGGINAVAVLAKILEAPPPRLDDGLAPELRDLLGAMLSKSPDERPRDGDEVLARLDAFTADGAATALVPRSGVGQEQRLVSVLLVETPPRWLAAAQTVDATEQRRLGDELDRIAASCGALARWLRDGTLLVTVASREGAVDQAAPIARCALGLRERLDGMRAALVVGRQPSSTGSAAPIGPIIDRAAGMLAGAEAGGIAVDEATVALLVGRYAITESEDGARYLAGAAPPLDVRRTLAGKPTRCEGRGKELALLEATLEECVDEEVGRAVLVTGPAGIGKSRLASELGERARDHARVVAARAEALRAASPWFVIRQLVRRLVGSDPVRDHLVSGADIDWHAELLADWLGVLPSETASPRLRAARQDPTEMRRQLQAALVGLLRAEARRQPLVLLVDDLQWADGATVGVLRRAVADDEAGPLMLVALARPEVAASHPSLVDDPSITHLRLTSLGRKAIERLARSVLTEAGDELVSAIADRAGGNALFAEELIRQAARGEQPTAPPASVLALLESRLGALAPEVRRVLRAASVFGETTWRRGIEAIAADASPEMVGACLEALTREEILSRQPTSRFSSTLELTFRHALIRDAAYAMLLEDERRAAHGAAARWLEHSGEPDPLVLGEHWSRSPEIHRAVDAFETAAQRALLSGSLADAESAAQRALSLGARGAQRGRLLLIQCEATGWGSGDFEAFAPLADEAMALLEPETREGFAALSMLGIAVITGHRLDAAERYLDACDGLEPELEPTASVGLSMLRHVNAVVHLGRPEIADALVARFDAVTRAADPDDDLARGYRLAVASQLDLHRAGSRPGAPDRAAEARACFERIHHELGIVNALFTEGATAFAERDAPRAREALESCQRLARGNINFLESPTIHYLGFVDIIEQKDDAAIRRFQHVAEHGYLAFRGAAEGCLAMLHLRGGDVECAEHHVERALELTERVPFNRPAALAVRAALDAMAGRHERARRCVDEGLALYRRVGGHPAIEKGLRRVQRQLDAVDVHET